MPASPVNTSHGAVRRRPHEGPARRRMSTTVAVPGRGADSSVVGQPGLCRGGKRGWFNLTQSDTNVAVDRSDCWDD